MAKKRCKNPNSFHEGEASDYTRIQEIMPKEICFSEALSYDFRVRSPALAESKRYRLNRFFFG